VALVGKTVGISVRVSLILSVAVVGLKDTLVTEMLAGFTITIQVSVLFPSVVVTMIFAEPSETAVTKPLPFTVAKAVLLLFQFTFLFVAESGKTVANNVSVSPIDKVTVFLLSETLVTATSVGISSSGLSLSLQDVNIGATVQIARTVAIK
jgi:hypothetical protein